MATAERILIVGGGIAGLTLATALQQQGFSAELVERSPEWPAVGAGITLQANGLRVLRALGLAAAVEQAGAVLRHWLMCDQQGAALSDTDLVEVWGEVGPCVGIARPALQQVLLGGAAGVPCRLGIAVTALTQEEDQEQRVQVSFSDGSSGAYDLVVGADGLGSTVRELALGPASIGYSGVMIWRSIVPTRTPRVTDTFTILLGDGCVFGQYPVGAEHTYGFGYVNGPRLHDPLEGRLERLRQRFVDFGGPVPAYLAALTHDEQIHCGPIEWVGDVAHWYRGRVVLIGDAAHAGPPTMGIVGCMAMEDAYVLAEELRRAGSVGRALDAYVARCRPRDEWVVQQSRAEVASVARPPAIRNPEMRERWDRELRDRFRPLIPAP
jgi:2-polyprenyl-6-methoxyphenol hydroxylase-like FAD-dependent oxidoreductase